MILDMLQAVFQAKDQIDDAVDQFVEAANSTMQDMAGNSGQETIVGRHSENLPAYADLIKYNWKEHNYAKFLGVMSTGNSQSAMDGTEVILSVAFDIMSAMVDAIQAIVAGAAVDVAGEMVNAKQKSAGRGASDAEKAATSAQNLSDARAADDQQSSMEFEAFRNSHMDGKGGGDNKREVDKNKVREYAGRRRNSPGSASKRYKKNKKRGEDMLKKTKRRKDGTLDPSDAIEAAIGRLVYGPTKQQSAVFMEMRHSLSYLKPVQVTGMGITIIEGRAVNDPTGSLYRRQEEKYLSSLRAGERKYKTMRAGQGLGKYDYSRGEWEYVVPDYMDGYNPYKLQREMFLGQYDSRGQYGMGQNYTYSDGQTGGAGPRRRPYVNGG